MSVGGLSQAKDATPEIQKMADQVRDAAEQKAGQKYSKFEATQYRTQVVAGTNYFIKVDCGDGLFVHVRVFEPLPPDTTPQFVAIQKDHTKDDEITYF
jgi:cystatin-A/B